ncbi:MAG TPA: fibronectin type III domain-containing protein, partial [Bacteroidales bacterium]|nr:fibronectin type III domain-containing protein [Bacteroidales bacterium]
VNGSGEGPYYIKWNEPGNKHVSLTLEEDGCSSTFASKIQITPIAEVYLDVSATEDSICAGQTVRFTATPDNFSNYSFYKNETLLQSSSENTFEGSEFSDGDKVYVSITDLNGCTKIISDTIRIHIKPTPNISLSNNTANDSACFEDPVIFTASPSTYDNYVFFVNNEIQQNSTDNQFLTTELEQGDRVHVTTTSNECTSPVSNIERITLVDALPPPQVYCGSSDPNSINFAWDPVDDAIGYEISIDNNPVWITPNSGSTGLYHQLTGLTANELHSIRVRTIDDFTCGVLKESIEVTCEARACAAIEFNLDNPTRHVCEGERVELNVEGLNIVNYEINWNYEGFGNNLSYSLTALSDTVVPVEIKNLDEPACPTVTKRFTIVVTPKGSINLSCDAEDLSICGDKSVLFTVEPVNYDHYTLYDNSKEVITSSLNSFSFDKIKDQHYFFATAKDGACVLFSDSLTFNVEQPLEVPVVNFQSSTENSITFSWDAVPGAIGYLVSRDNGIFITPSSGTTGLTHTVSPLEPGSAVSLSVIAIGEGLCGNSDISQPAIGYAETCSSISFNIQDKYDVCSGDTIDLEILDLSLPNYKVSWGLRPPSRKKSVTMIPMKDTVVFVTVKNPRQPFCAGVTKFVDIKVTKKPQKLALSSPNANEACIGSLIEFTGTPGGYDQYEFYDYGKLIEQGSYNSIDIYGEEDHTYNIRARAVNDACYGDFSNVIESRVLSPLPRPQPNCGTTTQNSIEFRWDPVPDASSYLVNVDGTSYKLPNSGPTGLTHSVTGLGPEDPSSIQVMAIGPTPCSDSDPSVQLTCYARDCDMVDFVIDPYQTVCENENIDLEISSVSVSNYDVSWEEESYGNNTTFSYTGTEDTIISVSLLDN